MTDEERAAQYVVLFNARGADWWRFAPVDARFRSCRARRVDIGGRILRRHHTGLWSDATGWPTADRYAS